MRVNELAERIVAYKGGPVERELVEVVIDFNILMEPEWGADDADDTFKERTQEQWKGVLQKGDVILRAYSKRFPLESGLTAIYYDIVNSSKYRQSIVHQSVASSTLRTAWWGGD